MNQTTKRCITAALAAGLCLLLTGCGNKVETPEAYVIGENSTVPLDNFLDEEEGGKLTAIAAPETEEEQDEEKDDKKEAEPEELSEKTGEEASGEEPEKDPNAYTYTYEEVPAAALERYAAALVAEDEGFTVIDTERVPQTELPEFEGEEGSAVFARKAVEEDFLFQVAISWTEKECNVVVSCPEGGFYEEDSGESGEPEDGNQIMTLLEVVDYVRTLRPADLGLEGESMGEYELIPVQGSPLVDGEVCRHLNIYQTDPAAGTNRFVGSYLVGIGKIYRLDPIQNTVERIH